MLINLLLTAFCAALLILMLRLYRAGKKPLRLFLVNMTIGGVTLLGASIAGSLLGLSLSVNLFTSAVALLLGAPGTLLLSFCANVIC